MFDHRELDDLDRVGASDALAEVRRRLLAVEAEQLYLAAHWADLHAPEFVEDCEAVLPGEPGAERTKRLGGDGCPEMEEFAGAELAALLGRSTGSGENLIADAVTLRHRHPGLWRGIREGRVRVWLAVRAGRLCTEARLSQEQAHQVDAETTPYVETLPPGRYLKLVLAAIVRVDPDGAEARRRAAELERFVRAGQTDAQGLRTLVARARSGDVTLFLATIDRIAAILADRGDTDTVEVRRSTALRILANPAEALELLASAALQHLDAAADPRAGEADPADAAEPAVRPDQRRAAGAEEPEPDEAFAGYGAQPAAAGSEAAEPATAEPVTAQTAAAEPTTAERTSRRPDHRTEGAARWTDEERAAHRRAATAGERWDGRYLGRPEEWVGWMRGADGEPLPLDCLRDDLVPPGHLDPDPPPDPPDPPDPLGGTTVLGLGDRELLERLVAGAGRIASRMAPVAELHVHVGKASMDAGSGVARSEELGPTTLAQVRSWLIGEHGSGRARIRVQPVLDPEGVAAVDRYEVPPPLRRAVEELQPFDAWPWGTTDARQCDQDHVKAYRPDGTPGQTALGNLAPLGRRHHRIKTFGAWRVKKVGTSTFWWRSPTGHWFHVGPSGTCHVGRGADLDAVLLRETAHGELGAQKAS